jgi:hypothetical protein
MNKQHLIDKVKKHLKNSKIPFIEETIEYIGIKRNFLIKNEKKDMHFIGFASQINKESPYTSSYFIFIDVKTEKLELLVGPQYTEEI